MSEIEDFTRRYPNGTDVKLPETFNTKSSGNFIPGHYFRALEVNALIEYAKAKGYSEDDCKKIRAMLMPVLPSLVSLDDIYGKDEE